MRKFLLNIVFLLLGLTSGLISTSSYISINTLPYCVVAHNSEWFNGKKVKVRGLLIFGSNGMYLMEECDGVYASASFIEMEDAIGTGPRVRNYVEELLTTGKKQGVKQAEAIIKGRFNGENSSGCWSPRFHITAEEVRLESEVTTFNTAGGPGDGWR